MKRAIQIFAVTLISLLAAGPAWAAVSCALGNTAMGASCPMGMPQMGADCPMAQDLAMTYCSQDCCNGTMSQAIVFPGIPAQSKIATTAPGVLSLNARRTGASADHEPFSLAVTTSPPRYLLLRVFRI